MTVFIAMLFLIVVAAFAARRCWVNGRQIDHVKKQDDMQADGVEIIVQKPVHERRLKLALPDISSVQIRAPVVPMKSSIRSALKELRSRQMVQSLCSKFETRLRTVSEPEESVDNKAKKSSSESKKARRRDASVAPVLSTTAGGLASGLAREAEITAKARSNNLNKFLRSYASNLDNAITAEKRVVTVTRLSTEAADDIEQPLLARGDDTRTASETLVDNDDGGMEHEFDLPRLELELEYSNQVDSPILSEDETSVLVEATDCDPIIDEDCGVSDKGNNNVCNNLDISFCLSIPTDNDSAKQSDPEKTQRSDNKFELLIPPALARFKQQVPSNGRRARITLNI